MLSDYQCNGGAARDGKGIVVVSYESQFDKFRTWFGSETSISPFEACWIFNLSLLQLFLLYYSLFLIFAGPTHHQSLFTTSLVDFSQFFAPGFNADLDLSLICYTYDRKEE
ncbi:hypothetical protein BJ508DRAFT_72332 [Ascobolus immersus RN42]|uniref:Uncharacterized protein n=1 Tax=Ascobolus immersus RN42 TaxID=1160509 RepID=A0A3N4HIT8_ASCIM|nr:hypothetical protein BJ508DRAFT_72332 [Ascobolus immersus RN42]